MMQTARNLTLTRGTCSKVCDAVLPHSLQKAKLSFEQLGPPVDRLEQGYPFGGQRETDTPPLGRPQPVDGCDTLGSCQVLSVARLGLGVTFDEPVHRIEPRDAKNGWGIQTFWHESKFSHKGTAGFSPHFHLPGFHVGYQFLTLTLFLIRNPEWETTVQEGNPVPFSICRLTLNNRDPYIIHLSIALSMVVSLILVEKAMFQMDNMYRLRSPEQLGIFLVEVD